MKTIVLGLGISGKAASRYLLRRGDEVIGVDKYAHAIDGVHCVDESSPIDFKGVDMVVKSPGIAQRHPWVCAAYECGLPVLGEVDLALEELKIKKKIVLAITGSNGKTTTTLMATHLMNVSGKKAVAAGNIGIPLIEQIDTDAEVFLVELSSFQLEHIVENRVLDGAAILNITPNHLDRHSSFEDYMRSKLRITSCLKENAPLYIGQQVANLCGKLLDKYFIFDLLKEKIETILPLSYRNTLYPHDLENVLAASAVTQVPDSTIKDGMETFVRPPHRLEFVKELSGISYINDSKATSVDAVIKAVQAIRQPILLIAGGVDKGGSFREWVPYFKSKVMRVLALGAAAKRIKSELEPHIAVDVILSLEEGVCLAAQYAPPGSAVLLSPGCSSYDQFRDFEQRGEAFRQHVMSLQMLAKEK